MENKLINSSPSSSNNYLHVIYKPESEEDFWVYYNSDLKEHKDLVKKIRDREYFNKNIHPLINLMIKTLENKGSIYLCGNGGSTSDASHIASELSGKFNKKRAALKVENLVTDLNYVTAVSNDTTYEDIFSRAIDVKVNENDLMIFLSTSGNSKNILEGIRRALEKNIKTVLVTGNTNEESRYTKVIIPSSDTARIQEAYMLIFHDICNVVERYFFDSNKSSNGWSITTTNNFDDKYKYVYSLGDFIYGNNTYTIAN